MDEIKAVEKLVKRFTGPLFVCPITSDEWVVINHFGFKYKNMSNKEEIIAVPIFFKTDLASIPAIVTPLLPKWSNYGWGAVIHDWLYWQQEESGFDRKKADRVLLQAMEISEVSLCRRTSIYLALRGLGWVAWRSNRKRKENGESKIYEGPLVAPFKRQLSQL